MLISLVFILSAEVINAGVYGFSYCACRIITILIPRIVFITHNIIRTI